MLWMELGMKFSKKFQASASQTSIIFWVLLLFFAGVATWSVVFTIDKSAVVTGAIEPQGKVVAVQNRFETKIKDILVDVGQHVEVNDVLFNLDPEQDIGEAKELEFKIQQLSIKKKRLSKQAKLQTNLENDGSVATSLFGEQKKILELEVLAFKTREQSLVQELVVIERELNSAHAKIENNNSLIKFLAEKVRVYTELYNSGFEGKLTLMEIEQNLADAQEKLQIGREDLEKLLAQKKSLQSKLEENKLEFDRSVAVEFSETASDLQISSFKLDSLNQRVASFTVKAAVSGVISKVNTRNPGEVIKSGTVMAEMIPDGRPLVFAVEVNPDIITDVYVDAPVLIYLSNMDARKNYPLAGTLVEIDPDASIRDDGSRFFGGVVSFEEASPLVLPGVDGSANIILGERSVLEYFLEPIIEALRGVLGE